MHNSGFGKFGMKIPLEILKNLLINDRMIPIDTGELKVSYDITTDSLIITGTTNSGIAYATGRGASIPIWNIDVIEQAYKERCWKRCYDNNGKYIPTPSFKEFYEENKFY